MFQIIFYDNGGSEEAVLDADTLNKLIANVSELRAASIAMNETISSMQTVGGDSSGIVAW